MTVVVLHAPNELLNNHAAAAAVVAPPLQHQKQHKIVVAAVFAFAIEAFYHSHETNH